MDEVRLSREQLKAITSRKRPKEIIEWLRAGAFVFRLDGNGWPIVHPEHYAQQMGVRGTTAKEARERAESKRKFEEALARMGAEQEQREQFLAERRRLKAQKDAALEERKRQRGEERQRKREERERKEQEKKLKKEMTQPVAPPPE